MLNNLIVKLLKNRPINFSIVFLLLFAFLLVFAAPPTSPYTPGETLDPSCAPGGTNCSVITPTTLFNNLLSATTTLPNLTPLLGLTNASTTMLTVSNNAWFTSKIKLPNGANPTVSLAGEVGVDTSATSGSALRFYGDNEYVLPGWQRISFVIDAPDANSDYSLGSFPANITIKQIRVLTTSGTNVIGGLDEADANGGSAVAIDSDITASAGTTATDDGTLDNPTVDANDQLNWHTTSISGTPTVLTVTVYFTYDAVN